MARGRVSTGGNVAVILAIAIAIISVMAAVVYFVKPLLITKEAPAEPGLPPGPTTGIVLTRLWKFQLVDTYGDNSNADGEITIYTTDGSLFETITVAGGVGTSTKFYTSRARYNVKVTATNFVTFWRSDYPVPLGGTTQDEYLISTANVVNVGTWSPKASQPDGTYLTDTDNAAVDNLSKETSAKPAITFEIRNTEDDSGWFESYDPLLKRTYKTTFYITIESGNFEDVIINAPGMQLDSRSTRKTWYVDVPTSSLLRDKDADGNYLSTGVFQKVVTLDMTGWTDSTAVKITYGIATYTSAEYYGYYGAWGALASTTEAKFVLSQ